jgi:DNA polymerase epsilon subunit 1
MHPTIVEDKENHIVKSAVEYYFIQEDGSTFKAVIPYNPYFYLGIKEDSFREVETYLKRKFDRLIHSIEMTDKVDLEVKNHLSGILTPYIKVKFNTVQDLLRVRSQLSPIVTKNKDRVRESESTFDEDSSSGVEKEDYASYIIDIREYDVIYYQRVSIDSGIRCAYWYDVEVKSGQVEMKHREDMLVRAEPRILAFDIETTKLPLKFPNPEIDKVMMISYMIDRQGYLIINRSIVSEDIQDFDYTPKPEYKGPFHTFNEKDEKGVLMRFAQHIRETKPNVYVTFNGDMFDWPFLERRYKENGMNMYDEIAVKLDGSKEFYTSRFAPHLDAHKWVDRDSYLPHGSRNLKAVTKAKLGYNPIEIDPEEMVKFAAQRPQEMANYSVSDAVATYYLYMQYVHPFIFSLCNIISMHPEDVSRKGTGTLCESLLMTEAFKANIIYPNKKVGGATKVFKGHPIESETYVGGHVESLAAGIYRSDLPLDFKLSSDAVQQMIDQVEEVMKFAVEKEAGVKVDEVENWEEIRRDIVGKLEALKNAPQVTETPLIYHVDVAAMYPNIILTNRLQPTAVVDEQICSGCVFNQPENQCQRKLDWEWRVDYLPISKGEYDRAIEQLEIERFTMKTKTGEEKQVRFWELPREEQKNKIKKRIKDICRTTYKKTHETETVLKKDTVCMRENPFYVDTVRAFRDRRYTYKNLQKVWNKKNDTAKKEQSAEKLKEAQSMLILYDSLQLAHKCILNSFYGYVMRKGSRWYSMEMAGIVTHTGSNIIKRARELIEAVGKPLELDTDGIWCALPKSFPENYEFKLNNPDKKSFVFSYLCTALNAQTHREFNNEQYQTLINAETLEYETKDECTIFFEVDGPYRAMILPTSKDEGKQIKKRYAIFAQDGRLAELKGFEIKRRGELKLIKDFQSQIFSSFLEGKSLSECYDAVAKVAEHYLTILETRGEALDDEELLGIISESKNMSRKMEDYATTKSPALTCAKRLGEFLGQISNLQGMTCRYIVSTKPEGTAVAERVIPAIIFSAPVETRVKWLRLWCKDNALDDDCLRDIVDWEYYKARLQSTVQKMITLPAHFQGIENPLKDLVPHPDWLIKNQKQKEDAVKQRRIDNMFMKVDKPVEQPRIVAMDIEDMGSVATIHSASASSGYTGESEVRVNKGKKRSRKSFEGDKYGMDVVSSEEETEEPPKEEEDYQGWLAYQKNKWKKLRRDRKRRKELFGDNAKQLNNRNATGFESLFQRQSITLLSKPWQIIQIAETNTPGKLKIWLLDDNSMFSTYLLVPRRFYLNCYSTQHETVGKKVASHLPRSRKRFYLYDIELDEDKYQSSLKEIELQRVDPEVEGFYESQLPLEYRAVLDLGCMAKVKSSAKDHPTTQPWTLDKIDTLSSTQYLTQIKPRFVYLYQSQSDPKTLVGLYFPHIQRFVLIFGTPHSQEVMGSVKTNLSELKGFSEMNLNVEILRESSLDKAVIMANVLLSQHKTQYPGPIVLVCQTSTQTSALKRNMPLLEEFPKMEMAPHEKDNQYPLFGWFTFAAASFAQRALQIGKWFDTAILLARYAQVPIGNFGPDFQILLSDIFFARRLKQNDHVLWWSNSDKPDLGGNEENDNGFVDELANPEICRPICHETISIEIDVTGLAINTILSASHIADLEGNLKYATADDNTPAPALAEDDDGTKSDIYFHSVDEAAACARAFKILKNLVTSWSVDVFKNDKYNPSADIFVRNFYRWISSPQSKLYDPAIHRLVHRLIKKVFLQLLNEMKQLGAKVIYANFNKIIIGTEKMKLHEADSYFKFLVKTITKKPVFQYIQLEAKRYWDVLLFKDKVNYLGIPATEGSVDEEDIVPVAEWNIAQYLPKTIEKHFFVIVYDFVLQLYKNRKARGDAPRPTDASQNKASQAAKEDNYKVVDMTLDNNWDEEDAATAKSKPDDQDQEIISYLTQRLFVITQDVQRSLSNPEVNEDDEENPGRSLVQDSNPALDFIKAVCHVLSLKKSLEIKVATLKRNLLKMVNVREFATEAEFRDPCVSYTLPDVICSYCNNARDLDFLRDPNLLKHIWKCGICSHSYNKQNIERRLIDIVQKRSLAYQTQDLVCEKCKMVKAENTSQLCSNCSGNFACRENAPEFKQGLQVFLNIAKYHDFKMLRHVVDWCMK